MSKILNFKSKKHNTHEIIYLQYNNNIKKNKKKAQQDKINTTLSDLIVDKI